MGNSARKEPKSGVGGRVGGGGGGGDGGDDDDDEPNVGPETMTSRQEQLPPQASAPSLSHQRNGQSQSQTPATSRSANASRHARSKSVSVRSTPSQRRMTISNNKQACSVRLRRASDFLVSDGQLRLTAGQVSLVRKLWQHVRVHGDNGPGLSILREHLFFRCPAIRQVFAHGADDLQSETNYHRRLMLHAETISDLLDELICSLESTEVVRDKLRHFGRLHAHARDAGFVSAFWDRFAEALNDCTLTWCHKAQKCFEAQVALTTIVLYITEQLKEGYYEECRRLRKSMYGASRRDHTPSRTVRISEDE